MWVTPRRRSTTPVRVSFGSSIVIAEFAFRRSTDWFRRAMSARLRS
jgi:hypothetical protein